MKTIEELKQEENKIRDEIRRLDARASEIRDLITSRSCIFTKNYIGKYFKFNKYGYCQYFFVTSAEKDFSDSGWKLKGFGFTTYVRGDNTIHYSTDSYGFDLDNFAKESMHIFEISKEEFYRDRNEILDKIKNEVYEG